MKKLGFIGMGNMASAIAKGALKSGFLTCDDIIAYDISETQIEMMTKNSIVLAANESDVISNSEIILIAVKPQVLEKIILPLKDKLKGKAIISIVLGYDFNAYEEILDPSTRHIFVMPNTPVQVLKGMSLIENKHTLTWDEFNFVKLLFSSLGEIEVIPSHLLSVGGALSGCGPAYIYMVIEALADGAVKEGMPRTLAYKLASQTVLGSGGMQLETKMHPGILKDNVCSPGGSTIRGVEALENGSLRAVFINAISASMHYK